MGLEETDVDDPADRRALPAAKPRISMG